MDTSLLTALSGTVGTILGVSATMAVAWVNQRTQHRREAARKLIESNEALYGEFIDECARQLVDAVQHQLEKPEAMLPVYALINRIRLCASSEVLAEAERLLGRITEQFFAPNLSVVEVRQLTLSSAADPLRSFGEACRREIGLMRERL